MDQASYPKAVSYIVWVTTIEDSICVFIISLAKDITIKKSMISDCLFTDKWPWYQSEYIYSQIKRPSKGFYWTNQLTSNLPRRYNVGFQRRQCKQLVDVQNQFYRKSALWSISETQTRSSQLLHYESRYQANCVPYADLISG